MRRLKGVTVLAVSNFLTAIVDSRRSCQCWVKLLRSVFALTRACVARTAHRPKWQSPPKRGQFRFVEPAQAARVPRARREEISGQRACEISCSYFRCRKELQRLDTAGWADRSGPR